MAATIEQNLERLKEAYRRKIREEGASLERQQIYYSVIFDIEDVLDGKEVTL